MFDVHVKNIGKGRVGKGGIVTDPAVQSRVVEDVASAADSLGLSRIASLESPITGAEGNKEFLIGAAYQP